MFSDPSNAPNFVSTIQFEDEGSVVTALLLEGAIVDSKPISVCRYSNQIEQNHEFQEILKDKPFKSTGKKQDDAAGTISGRLAKMKAAGYNLGQNAFVKAQAFDEKHSVTSSAKSVASSVASTASSAGKKGLQIASGLAGKVWGGKSSERSSASTTTTTTTTTSSTTTTATTTTTK